MATSNNLSSRRRVDSGKPIEWKPKPWKKEGDDGGDQRSPDLAALLQHVVDLEDWQLGNAAAFFITGAGKRVACSHDGDAGKAPKLVIELESDLPRVRVAAKEDDAEEWADGSVSLDSSDLELTTDEKNPGPQVIGLRFRDLQIPQGQRLESAYLQFTTDEVSESRTELSIGIEDHADPPPFKGEKANVSGRSLLGSPLTWEPDPWPAAGEESGAQRSPDLAPLLQRLVDREDWKPGNAASFLVRGIGRRTAVSFDGKKEEAPKLMVDFVREPNAIPEDQAPRFTVRLHFLDPDALPPGERLCDVRLQGRPVLRHFDIAAHRSVSEQVVVREFTNIPIANELEIEFDWTGDESPVISGIELIRENGQSL